MAKRPPKGASAIESGAAPTPIDPAVELAALRAERDALKSKSKTANTNRNYEGAQERFKAWCERYGLCSLPATPDTVSAYLTFLAHDKAASTINVARSAIRALHDDAGLTPPTVDEDVKRTTKSIRRELGVRPNAKDSLPRDEVMAMIATLPNTIAGKRNRAVLLVGFMGAFRRSELVGIQLGDVTFPRADSMVILVRKSKTDQEGAGMEKTFQSAHSATCPVGVLREWIAAAGLHRGPLFRRITAKGVVEDKAISAGYVARIVKRAAKAAGFDARRYSGHSLRAGYVTECAARGMSIDEIKAQTGQKSAETVLRYVRRADRMKKNVSELFELGDKPAKEPAP